MKSHKLTITSNLLGRMAHADVFELGSPQTFLFVLFGGSGIDEEEYERRAKSVIPVFDPVLEKLAQAGSGRHERDPGPRHSTLEAVS
jgi:hypothetical protein